MGELPKGTVTFLFTDVEGSTRLFQQLGADYPTLLAQHYEVMRAAVGQNGGAEVKTLGDGFFAAFDDAGNAVSAALAAQLAHRPRVWPGGRAPRIRMGLHTGAAVPVGDDYAAMPVHQAARVSAAAHGGQVVLSEVTRRLVEGAPVQDVSFLDLGEHRLKDLANPMRLFQMAHPALETDFPPLRTLDLVPHNLPVQLTSFVGRDVELREVRKLLTESRIVTLSGAGGCGKTRLALQLGAELATNFAGGVWFVDLAPLADPGLVLTEIAGALQLHEAPGQELVDVVVNYLNAADRLLILDNCEHLLDQCAELAATLAQRCPSLRMLATSREALRVTGETTWRVPSLAVEEESGGDDVLASPAVRLFLERAHAVAPEVVISGAELGSVARICRRLDGIPLAIELAAARMDTLDADHIERRLDDRFRLLAGGSRAALERQRTLRAAVDWSYELLYASEKTLLARLSVFAGGFTIEAADAVCSGEPISADDVLDSVTGLTRKSLVTAERTTDGVWYRLTETVRQYAVEKLGDDAAVTALRHAHLAFYVDLVARFDEAMVGREPRLWLERVDRELDNVYAAMDWGATEDPDAAASLVWGLRVYWEVRGRLRDGRERSASLLDGPSLSGTARIKALLPAAQTAWRLGELEAAQRWAEEACTRAEAAAETRLQAHATNTLSNILAQRDDVAGALKLNQQAIDLAGAAADESIEATALGNRALWLDDRHSAEQLTAQAVSIFRRLGNVRGEVFFSSNLANVRESTGRLEEAAELRESALAGARELGYKGIEANILGAQGHLSFVRGFLREGERLLREAIRMLDDLGESWIRIGHLFGLASLLPWLGDVDGARGAAKRVIELGQQFGSPVIELGGQMRLATLDGDFAAALEFCERALEYDSPVHARFVLDRAAIAVIAGSIPAMEQARADLGALDVATLGRSGLAQMRLTQSLLALATGDADVANELALPALAISVEDELFLCIPFALLVLATIEASQGNLRGAGYRIGAAEAVLDGVGAVPSPELAAWRDKVLADCDSHQLEPARAAARALGREAAEDFARRLVAGDGTADLEEPEVP